jgi:hypothetical protein
MSIETYKKQLWEQAIIEEYANMSIADMITAQPSDVNGVCAIYNRSNITNGLQDYDGADINFEEINTVETKLFFNVAKYFAFQMKDLDRVQAVNGGALMLKTARDMAQAIKDCIDKAVLEEAVAGAKHKIEDDALAVEDVYNDIVELGTKLDEANVPAAGRYIVARPEYVNMLALDPRVVDNAMVLPNGVVQGMQINGMQVIKSNLVPEGKVIALNNEAVGYGKQIDELEAIRLEKNFADAIKGLVNFGVKTLRPEAIAVLSYTLA